MRICHPASWRGSGLFFRQTQGSRPGLWKVSPYRAQNLFVTTNTDNTSIFNCLINKNKKITCHRICYAIDWKKRLLHEKS